jgi:hypothetical protein
MISISCTNCKALLTIDEAFAGGVCRCQHCGTIQTVPTAAGKGGAGTNIGSAVSGQSLGGSKIIATKQATSGTGLDELADIVASSGLAGSGLSSRRLSRSSTVGTAGQAGGAAPVKAKMLPVAIGGAAVGAVVVGLVLFFVLRGASPSDVTSTGDNSAGALSGGDGSSNAAASRGPSFAGVAVDGNNIAYVLDCGSGTREVFELLKMATLRSIASLGPNRKFQVLFWANGQDPPQVFPATGLTYATDKKIDELRVFFDGMAAYGATDAAPALEKAYSQSPDAVVLATGKGPDLSEEFFKGVTMALRGPKIRTYTFAVGEGGSEVLKKVADSTNAEYRQVSPSQLNAMVR